MVVNGGKYRYEVAECGGGADRTKVIIGVMVVEDHGGCDGGAVVT